jgi:hypothetical protein
MLFSALARSCFLLTISGDRLVTRTAHPEMHFGGMSYWLAPTTI